MRKVLEIAIGLRQSYRNDFAPIAFPIQDHSLKIIPKKSRFLNKKETLDEAAYAEQIQASAAKPMGGANAGQV